MKLPPPPPPPPPAVLGDTTGRRLPAFANDDGNDDDDDDDDIGTVRDGRVTSAEPGVVASTDADDATAAAVAAAVAAADSVAAEEAVAAADSVAAEEAATAAAARRADLDFVAPSKFPIGPLLSADLELVEPSTLPIGPLEFRLCCSVTLMLSLLGVLLERKSVAVPPDVWDAGGDSGGGVCVPPPYASLCCCARSSALSNAEVSGRCNRDKLSYETGNGACPEPPPSSVPLRFVLSPRDRLGVGVFNGAGGDG